MQRPNIPMVISVNGAGKLTKLTYIHSLAGQRDNKDFTIYSTFENMPI